MDSGDGWKKLKECLSLKIEFSFYGNISEFEHDDEDGSL